MVVFSKWVCSGIIYQFRRRREFHGFFMVF